MIDLNDLGTEYNVIDEEGSLVRVLKIINHKDILASALGEYNEEFYKNDYTDYIMSSINRLSGFPKDPYSIYWHTCLEDEFELLVIIDKCLEEGYEYVILELLDDDDLDYYP